MFQVVLHISKVILLSIVFADVDVSPVLGEVTGKWQAFSQQTVRRLAGCFMCALGQREFEDLLAVLIFSPVRWEWISCVLSLALKRLRR